LPDAQNLSTDIILNGDSTILTIQPEGRYYISFSVRLTEEEIIGARLIVNGDPVASATLNAVLPRSELNGEAILTLPANSSLSVELFDYDGVVSLQSGAGATLTILRLV
jgi:hypothetical protein